MYDWFLSKLPRKAVDAIYCLWYIGLILGVLMVVDLPAADFYYLRR